MLEVLAYALVGVALGVVTGLIPGLHVNNLTPFLVALAAGASSGMAALIVAMSITNVFINNTLNEWYIYYLKDNG